MLKAANIASESEKLARATAKLEYKDMREKLARIFGDPGVLEEKSKGRSECKGTGRNTITKRG